MDTLSTQQAAELRQVHQQLIIRWIRQGKIQATALGTGRRKIWLIDKASLLAYKPPPKGHPKKVKEQ